MPKSSPGASQEVEGASSKAPETVARLCTGSREGVGEEVAAEADR